MRTIHWWKVGCHWFSGIANIGESAEGCLQRSRKNLTLIIISCPSNMVPFEWEESLRFAVLKPHLSQMLPY